MRTRRHYTQQERQDSKQAILRQRRRRRPYQRRNTVDKDGRTVPTTYLSARLPQVYIDLLEYVLRLWFFNLTNKCPYYYTFSFKGERLSIKRWQYY